MFDRVLGRENPCAFKLIVDVDVEKTPEKTAFEKLRDKQPKLYDLLMNYVALGNSDFIKDTTVKVLFTDLLNALAGEGSGLISALQGFDKKNKILESENKSLKTIIKDQQSQPGYLNTYLNPYPNPYVAPNLYSDGTISSKLTLSATTSSTMISSAGGSAGLTPKVR